MRSSTALSRFATAMIGVFIGALLADMLFGDVIESVEVGQAFIAGVLVAIIQNRFIRN